METDRDSVMEPSLRRISSSANDEASHSSDGRSAPWSRRGSGSSQPEGQQTSFSTSISGKNPRNVNSLFQWFRDLYFSSNFRIAVRGTLGYFFLSLFVFVTPMYNDTYGPLAIEMYLLIVTFGVEELHFGFISQGAIQSTTSLVMAAGLGALGAYAGEASYGITLAVAIIVTFLFTLLHADSRIAFISSMGEMFFMFNLLDSRARGNAFILEYFYDTLIGAALSHAISLVTGILIFPCLAKQEMRRNLKKCLRCAGIALSQTASFALEPRVEYVEPFNQFTLGRTVSSNIVGSNDRQVAELDTIPEEKNSHTGETSAFQKDEEGSPKPITTNSVDPYLPNWLDKIPWDTYLLERIVDGNAIQEASDAAARGRKMLNAIAYEPNLWQPFHNESLTRWKALMDAIDEMLRSIRGLQSIIDGERRRYRAETLEQWHAMLPGLREHFATLATMCVRMSEVIDELKCGRPQDWIVYLKRKWRTIFKTGGSQNFEAVEKTKNTEAMQRWIVETLQSSLFSWSSVQHRFRSSVQKAYKECFDKYQSPSSDQSDQPLLAGMLTMEWGPLLFVVTSSKVLQDTIGTVQDEIIYLAVEETKSSWGNFLRNCFGWLPICFMMFEQYWKIIRNFPLTWRAWIALVYTAEFQFSLKKWLGEVVLLIVLLISPIHNLLTKYDGTWMWMSYILYITPSVEGTLFGGLLTITGVGIGAGISFILTYFHYPARSPYILDTYLTLATAITVFNVNNPFSLSFVTFCFSSYVIILYQYSPYAYITNWHYAVSRFVMISLGAVIAIFLNEFVLPHSAVMDARENLAAALRRENTLHSWYLQSFVSGSYKDNVPGDGPVSPDGQMMDEELEQAEQLVMDNEVNIERQEERNGDDSTGHDKDEHSPNIKHDKDSEQRKEYVGKIQIVPLDTLASVGEAPWAEARCRTGRRRGSSLSDGRSTRNSHEQTEQVSYGQPNESSEATEQDEQIYTSDDTPRHDAERESSGRGNAPTQGPIASEKSVTSSQSARDRKETVTKSHKVVDMESEIRKQLADTKAILDSIQNGVGSSVHAIPQVIWTALSYEQLILDRLSAFHSVLEYEPILVGQFQNSALEDFLRETTEQIKVIVIARRTLVEIMMSCLMDGHPFRSFQFLREFGWKSARNTVSAVWFSADFARRVTENTATFVGGNLLGNAASFMGQHTSHLVHSLTGDYLNKLTKDSDLSQNTKERDEGKENLETKTHRQMEMFASLLALSELYHFKDTAATGASHFQHFLKETVGSVEKKVVNVPVGVYSWLRGVGTSTTEKLGFTNKNRVTDSVVEKQPTDKQPVSTTSENATTEEGVETVNNRESQEHLSSSETGNEQNLSLPVDEVLEALNAITPTTPWSFWEDLDGGQEDTQLSTGLPEEGTALRQSSEGGVAINESQNPLQLNLDSTSRQESTRNEPTSTRSLRRIRSQMSSQSHRTHISTRPERSVSERLTEGGNTSTQIRKKRRFANVFSKFEKGLSTGVKQVGTAGGSMFLSVVNSIVEGEEMKEPPVVTNLRDACKALRHTQGQIYIQYLDWVQKHQQEIIHPIRKDTVGDASFEKDPRFENADDLMQWYALFFVAFYVLDSFQQMCRALIDAIHRDIETLREEHRLAVEKQVLKARTSAEKITEKRRIRRRQRKKGNNGYNNNNNNRNAKS
eukprot:jgi/Galph1/6081/GphlegSOOS_G4710.1